MGARLRITLTIVAMMPGLVVGSALVSQVKGAAPRLAPLRVASNRLLAGESPIQLRGVNFSGAQYECLTNDRRVWDVPANAATITAMHSWQINAVRVPLNEDCWLGINGLPNGYSAQRYRREVLAWVNQLHSAGMYVLLNLHVVAPGQRKSSTEEVMADADHAPAFWRSVAGSFKDDHAVIFDLYNEPKKISWACWRDGCQRRFRIAGMQRLLDAVRASRARNPVMADGIDFANDLSGWLHWRPRDPNRQLIAGFHDYDDQLGCERRFCWDRVVAAVVARFPVIAGEIGEFDCRHDSVDRVMNWADAHHMSYLAWAWNSTDCKEPSLLRALDGTPSAYGAGVRDHLRQLAQAAKT